MKKRLLSLFLVAVMMLTTVVAFPIATSAEVANTWNPAGGVYKISTTADMVEFESAVDDGNSFSGKTVTLENDIELPGTWGGVGKPGGTNPAFQGHFDGQGHTITMTGHTASSENGAVFAQVGDGAVIENFKVDGTYKMASSKQYAAGVVNWARGTVKISNVVCSVDFVMAGSVDTFERIGGILSSFNKVATDITIDNCVYDGTMNLKASSTIAEVGGIMGRVYNDSVSCNITISNCVYGGTINLDAPKVDDVGMILDATENKSTVTVTIKDCIAAGTITFSERCTSGFGAVGTVVGWKHYAPTVTVENVYYRDLKRPDNGSSFSVAGSGGYQPTSTNNVKAMTEDELVNLTAETLGFSPNATYSFKANDGEIKYYPCPTGVAPTDGSWLRGLTVGYVEPEPEPEPALVIDSADDLLTFAQNVNSGNNYYGELVVLGADIDLTGETWSGIGVACSKNFSGTFDGCGYTVNIGEQDYERTGSEVNVGALFNSVQDATIKNVKVVGTMNVSGSALNGTSGLVAYVFGDVKIENAHSSVDINLTGNKTIVGGLVAQLRNANVGDLTIDGCIYDGMLNFANQASKIGGFIGYTGQNSSAKKTVTIKNSVFAGQIALNDKDVAYEIGGFIGQVYANGTSNAVSVTLSDNIYAGKITYDTSKDWTKDCFYWGAFIGGLGADWEGDLSNASGIKTLNANNLYYIPHGTTYDFALPAVGKTAAVIASLGANVTNASTAVTSAELGALTASDFSADTKLAFNTSTALDTYYPCPAALAPEEGWLAVLTVSVDAKVLGAQIRYLDDADQYTGIRFVAQFKADAEGVANAGSADATFGVILISKANYKALESKTFEALSAAGVKVNAIKATTEDGIVTVKAVIYNIDVANYTDEIVAIPYIGTALAGDGVARSIYSVAQDCVADANATAAAKTFAQEVINVVEG